MQQVCCRRNVGNDPLLVTVGLEWSLSEGMGDGAAAGIADVHGQPVQGRLAATSLVLRASSVLTLAVSVAFHST